MSMGQNPEPTGGRGKMRCAPTARIIVFRKGLTPRALPTEGALRRPGQQHYLAAESTPVDPRMDRARRCER